MGARSSRFSSILTAKAILLALLLGAVLSVSVPVASVSADSICRLACCAGRAPHAAGFCTHGSCSSPVLPRRGNHAHRKAAQKSETLCGLPRRADLILRPTHTVPTFGTNSFSDSGTANNVSGNESDRAQISAALATKSCPPDCSGCASGLNRRQRNSAGVTHAERLRPPSHVGFVDLCQHLAQTRDGLFRCGPPRGPPVLFS
jgi:hypothetical protein